MSNFPLILIFSPRGEGNTFPSLLSLSPVGRGRVRGLFLISFYIFVLYFALLITLSFCA